VKVELSQEKIEHAVLWSIVRQDYSDGFIDAEHVAQKLNGYFARSQIDAAIEHLVDCEMLKPRHAPFQKHFEPTRLAYVKIDHLRSKISSFVGRLDKHGPSFLSSQAAKDARLESQILPPAPTDASTSNPNGSGININVAPTISPNFVNEGPVYHAPTFTQGGDHSATKAAWFGGWGAWVGAALALIGILVTLWISGKL